MRSLFNEIGSVARYILKGFAVLILITGIAILGFKHQFLLYIAIFALIELVFLGVYMAIQKVHGNHLSTQTFLRDKGVILLTLFSFFITLCGVMIHMYGGSPDSFRYTPLQYECKASEGKSGHIAGMQSLLCLAFQGGLFRKLIGSCIIPLAIIFHLYYLQGNGLSKK